MKKILALLLALCLGTMALAGCGEESGSSESSNGTENNESAASSESSSSFSAGDSGKEITFDGLEVVNNDECSIEITGIEDTRSGYTLKAELENKSADKTYMFAVYDAYINGVACDPFFASTVAPGKKSIESITFSSSSTSTLDEAGVGDYADIELSFRVYDSDDWTADDVVNMTVHVYPFGEENATTFTRELKDSDTVLVDNDYATVILTGIEPDGFYGYTLNLYLVNKTDSEAMFSARDVSVNGYMCDGTLASSVAGGRSKFADMYWFSSTLEESNIDPESINNIEFTLVVYDDDNYTGDYYIEQPITINP